MAFRIDPLIRKNARIFLEASQSQSVIPVTDSPLMAETLEKTWADLAKSTEGTPLHGFFTTPGRRPLDLYRKWIATVDPDIVPVATRFAELPSDGTAPVDGLVSSNAPAGDNPSARLAALVHDLVAPLQAVDATNDPDERCTIILGLSLMILEQRWDQLNDAFVINVAHEIHSTYDRVLGKMSAKKKDTYDPIVVARKFVCDLNAALFSIGALREAFMTVTAENALFLIEEKRIYPKLEFASPTSPGKLDARCYEDAFVAEQIDKLRAMEEIFGRQMTELQPLFPEADWDGETKPRQFALLLVSLWDNEGLLSRINATELVKMASKHGPAWERTLTPLRMALSWVEAIRKIHRLAELLPTIEKLKPLDTTIAWDEIPAQADGTPGRLDRYMAKIRERETELNAVVFGIREKLVALGIDYNGVLDPILVEVLECLPERLVFPLETAQNFLHLAHRMGPLYEPLLFHIEEARREHSHLKKAYAFHRERINEAIHLIETKQFESVRVTFNEAMTNYKERFEDLDYGKIEACLAEWDQLLETHKTYQTMFSDFEKEVRDERPVGDRRLVLREHLEKWEAYMASQKDLIATEPDNDYRRDIEAFIDEISPKLTELHKMLLIPS
ncbi:hypothetical protein SAMN05444156_2569 [Verrucomicrobium sp. GAS474]|uniref:hypothetical protein n=1 Tax=Verrucomicrobium sp. GAS474 TaxID=1882831 RepID=UPI00087C80A8|nr:hypothetical protein [Verrucomicrobium sp. GAS474]SDU20131.1 hypothetical protein SAMN05444156_2569 [Verrucomicrobium sp. GAS474]